MVPAAWCELCAKVVVAERGGGVAGRCTHCGVSVEGVVRIDAEELAGFGYALGPALDDEARAQVGGCGCGASESALAGCGTGCSLRAAAG